MYISIRQATIQDTLIVSDILLEAALWLQQRGVPLWRDTPTTQFAWIRARRLALSCRYRYLTGLLLKLWKRVNFLHLVISPYIDFTVKPSSKDGE